VRPRRSHRVTLGDGIGNATGTHVVFPSGERLYTQNTIPISKCVPGFFATCSVSPSHHICRLIHSLPAHMGSHETSCSPNFTRREVDPRSFPFQSSGVPSSV
jgi:hypothetical protein